MYIAKQNTPTPKQIVARDHDNTGNLLPTHLKRILVQPREESQEFSPNAAQLSRFLGACCDCV